MSACIYPQLARHLPISQARMCRSATSGSLCSPIKLSQSSSSSLVAIGQSRKRRCRQKSQSVKSVSGRKISVGRCVSVMPVLSLICQSADSEVHRVTREGRHAWHVLRYQPISFPRDWPHSLSIGIGRCSAEQHGVRIGSTCPTCSAAVGSARSFKFGLF
jgi:hypothetical protein